MANPRPALSRYRKLVSDIRVLYEGARRALVTAYWKIGKRIVEEEQRGEIKAAYGDKLLSKLSEELSRDYGAGFSDRNLHRMRLFYLQKPISPPAAKLTWTQHAELLPVKNAKQRRRLEAKTVDEGLKSKELRALVQIETARDARATERLGPPAPVRLLKEPSDLRLHTYQKIGEERDRALEIDCGFYVLRTVPKTDCAGVTLTDKPVYVYEAEVERVIDGDTLAAVIDLGFETRVREKLRLRGLDCPELGTATGDAAKRFVEKCLPKGRRVLIKTQKSPERFGRFVADLWFTAPSGKRIYLNNLLLVKRLAVREEC